MMPSYMYDVLRIFSAKLVLEVFGGAGAIWGFSEAVTLRTPFTVWFWRPAALTVGVIFFVRWMLQIRDFIAEAKNDLKKTRTAEGEGENLVPVAYGTTA